MSFLAGFFTQNARFLIAFCMNKAGRQKAVGKINSKIFFELGQQRAFFEKPQKARGYWLKVKKMAGLFGK